VSGLGSISQLWLKRFRRLGSLENVIRTRVMLADISTWRKAARAHGEYFAKLKPACTFVEVARFIDPSWKVEIEVDCVVPG
jgi:enamine deaminase RidA (YjgF/YER057c/UK114 family)